MIYAFGIGIILVGFFVIWKTRWMIQNFGRIEWAEMKLGSTYVFYKILGVVLILFAFLLMGGGIVSILDFAFKR